MVYLRAKALWSQSSSVMDSYELISFKYAPKHSSRVMPAYVEVISATSLEKIDHLTQNSVENYLHQTKDLKKVTPKLRRIS